MRGATDQAPVTRAARVLMASASIMVLLCGALYANAGAQAAQKNVRSDAVTTGHDHPSTVAAARTPKSNALPPIPDVEAVDQTGRRLHVYSDLIQGKQVIVNFIFTSCTYICPLQGANFARLQAALGDRLGKDVSLVSISVDPQTDTPQRLKSWGERFGLKPGWTLVTGKPAEMDKLLRALTGDAAGVREHSSIAFIGNYDRGVWIRADALDNPTRLIKTLDDALGQKPNP
jgi:protein SCO1/2